MNESDIRAEGSQSVLRSIDILRSFSLDRPSWSARELIESTGLSSSTGHRLIKVLVDAGFLSRELDTHKYIAGPAIVDIAASVLNGSNDHELLRAALPQMEELHEATRETIGLYRRAGMTRVALAGLESPQPVRLTVSGGRVRPVFFGAPGKVLLAGLPLSELKALIRFATQSGVDINEAELRAQLDQIRETGFAISFEESTAQASSIAAPIVASDGRAIASMSISGPAYRWTAEAMNAARDDLRLCVRRTSELLQRKQHGHDTLAATAMEDVTDGAVLR